MIFFISATTGLNRSIWPTPTVMPAGAWLISSCASFAVAQIGFSIRTDFPAAKTCRTTPAWNGVGTHTLTASTFFKSLSTDSKAVAPCCCAIAFAAAAFRSQTPTSSTLLSSE